MKWRIIFISTGGLLALSFLGLLSLGIYSSIKGKKELEQIKQEIAANGGRLKADELDLPLEADVGEDFEAFCEQLKSLKELKQSIDDEYGYLNANDDEVGLYTPVQSASPGEFRFNEGKDWEGIQEDSNNLRQEWAQLIHFADTHQIHYVPDYSSGIDLKLEQLSPTLDTAKIASFLALLEIQRGQLDRACDYLSEGNAICSEINAPPLYTLIQGLVNITIDTLWLQNSRMILDHKNVTIVHIGKLHDLFQDRDYFKILENSFEGERLFFGNWMWDFLRREGSYNTLMIIGGMGEPDPIEDFLSTILTTFVCRPFLIDGDQAFYLNKLWDLEHYARSASTESMAYLQFIHVAKKRQGSLDNASWIDRTRVMFSNTTLPALDGAIKKFVWIESYLRQFRIAAAIEYYFLEHSRYPDDLDQLNQLNPQDLIDPITNEPMLYRLDDERGYVLYSRGENGVNDGGEIVPRRDGDIKYRDDTAPDWVWPRPINRN